MGSADTANGGDAKGAAIFCLGGYVAATNCEFISNTATAGAGSWGATTLPPYPSDPGGQALGGAIYSESGATVLEAVTLAANRVEGGTPGHAGSYPNDFSGAGGVGAGGGIYASNSTVVVGTSTFIMNNANGGGVPVGPAFLSGLASGDGLGGAIFVSVNSTGIIQKAVFTTNSAIGASAGRAFPAGGGRGGAVFSAGNLRISETTFANNNATGAESGVASSPGQGGAVCSAAHLELNGCALLSNYAIGGNSGGAHFGGSQAAAGQGGGIWSSGPLAATNSTVTANDAIGGETPFGGSTGGTGNGGGICITGASASLVNMTIAANRADGGKGSYVGPELGGGVFSTNAGVTIRGSIVANSSNGGDFSGTLNDAGYNLCSDGTAGFSGIGSLNQVDPMLSALSQNGGQTPTMGLLAGSPARDSIPSGFPPTDQRGVTRPQGPSGDIGAFEADFISSGAAILGEPEGATVRAGTNYTFAVDASGTAPLFYQWLKNGTPLAGANGSRLSLTNVQAADAGTYSVVVTNTFGTANSQGAALTVDSMPLLLSEPISVLISPGTTTNFDVLTDGPELSYQWWHDGMVVPGGTGPTLTINNAAAGSQGGYLAVISNFAGVVTSATATLSFDSSALSILAQPKSTSAQAGYSASFSVVASGVPPISYLWFHDGTPLAGQTNTTLSANLG